jgi:hypothetical protein
MEEIMLYQNEFDKIKANGVNFIDMKGNNKVLIGDCLFISAGYNPIEDNNGSQETNNDN